MKAYGIVWVLIPFLVRCQPLPAHEETSSTPIPPVIEKEIASGSSNKLDSTGNTPGTRFAPPPGYERVPLDSGSFAYYLRNFPLHPKGHAVHLYNGQLKSNQRIHAAVLNIDTGTQDLQQCADAIMRLWAEYNFGQKRYQAIQFHFVNGFLADYPTWRSGKGISVRGNTVQWVPSSRSNSSYSSFRRYLRMVFSYAGTLSLDKELNPKSLTQIHIGDVFIQGGSPGHAVIVIDMATNAQNGDKVFLLAQSYMPAQEIHLLKNLQHSDISPWYSVKEIGKELRTPEWSFQATDLKGF